MSATPQRPIAIADLVPGGVRQGDHVHRVTNDNTCSRCRRPVEDDDVPLMFWTGGGDDLLIYCSPCTGPDAWAALATLAPRP